VVELWKRSDGRRPQTLCRLSREGRARFLSYLAVLEEVVRDAARAAALNRRSASDVDDRQFDGSRGWAPA